MDDTITISGLGHSEILWADSEDAQTLKHATISMDVHGGSSTYAAHILQALDDEGDLCWMVYLYGRDGEFLPAASGSTFATANDAILSMLMDVMELSYPQLVPEPVVLARKAVPSLSR